MQLRSEAASRRLQEAQLAEQLKWTMEQHDLAIEERANVAKGQARFAVTQAQFLPGPGGSALPNPAYNPDVGSAFVSAFSGVPTTLEGQQKLLLGGAALQLQQAQAMDERATALTRGQAAPRAPSLIGVDQERQRLLQEQQKLTQARTADVIQGQGFAPTDTQKNLRALAEAETVNDKNAISALRKQLKLDGLTDTEMIKFRSELRSLDNDILMAPEEKERRREAIYLKYDKGGATTAPPPPTEAAPTEVDEKVIVIDPQGRRGRISRSQLERALKQGYKEFEG